MAPSKGNKNIIYYDDRNHETNNINVATHRVVDGKKQFIVRKKVGYAIGHKDKWITSKYKGPPK